jgi:hypothetical protein
MAAEAEWLIMLLLLVAHLPDAAKVLLFFTAELAVIAGIVFVCNVVYVPQSHTNIGEEHLGGVRSIAYKTG